MSQTKAQLLDGKSATIQFTGGSASAPSVSFTGDTNTGIYSPGADQVAISTGGSGRLFINSSGAVGLGTASPQTFAGFGALTLNGSTGSTLRLEANGTNALTIQASSSTDCFIAAQQAGSSLAFQTANTERLRITSAGLVGVGTSTPGKTLDVNGESRCTVAATINNGAAWYSAGSPGGYLYLGNGIGEPASIESYTPSSRSSATELALRFKTVSTSSVVTAMTIDSSQRVGIGTTTPSSTLDVNGDCAVANTRAYQVKDSSGTTRYAMYMSGSLSPSAGNDLFIGNTLANSLVLYTNSAERLRIDSSGRVGIGTSSPQAPLHVLGAVRFGLASPSTGGAGSIYNEGNNIAFEAFSANDVNTKRNILLAPYGGSVGIGTTTASARLQVDWNAGNQFRASNGSGTFDILNDSTNSLLTSSGPMFYRTGTSGPHIFQRDGGSSEVARIDSSGRLLVGTSSFPTGLYGSGTRFVVSQPANVNVFESTGNTEFGARLDLLKTRSSSSGGHTIVQANDSLGYLFFGGSDGTKYLPGAYVAAGVDGTPGVNDLPTRLQFATTADGASEPTERMRIDSLGRVGIGTAAPGAVLDVRGVDNVNAITLLDVWNTSTAAANQGALMRLITRNAANTSTSSTDFVKYQGGETSFRATDSSGFFTFHTGGFNERARIDSSGRLLVGTSSASGNALLQVVGGIRQTPFGSKPDTAGLPLEGETRFYAFSLAASATWETVLSPVLNGNSFFEISYRIGVSDLTTVYGLIQVAHTVGAPGLAAISGGTSYVRISGNALQMQSVYGSYGLAVAMKVTRIY